MNILLRLVVPGFEGAALSYLILLFHQQFWPEDLSVQQLRAFRRAGRWVIGATTIFAMIFDWRINLPLPPGIFGQ